MPPTEHRTTRPQPPYDHLATKADIAQLEVKLAQMQIEFAQLENRLTRWIIGTGIALIMGMGGMVLSAIIYLS